MPEQYDVVVIGGGPAGLAASIAAFNAGARVLLVEREGRLGGILKQCVHDGFGLVRYGEKLAGPEYANRFLEALSKTNVVVSPWTFVKEITKTADGFQLSLITAQGMRQANTNALLLATGCRERTAKQINIHGTRPAGVFTAGSAQFYTNILGQMPAKRCVILGSGDIGLIMARRLTLEGAQVLGVYEAKPIPSGLPRNIAQCLHDFDIPLHVSHTVTQVFGHERLTGVEIAQVDDKMRPIPGTEMRLDCDTLILSVGLIPENELAESLRVTLNPITKGPNVDQNGMTDLEGVFSCGNATHVNDLVDFVSESGEAAGRAAAQYAKQPRTYIATKPGNGFLYAVPQKIDLSTPHSEVPVFFRSVDERGATTVRVALDGKEIFKKKYKHLRPPEMERILLNLPDNIAPEASITLEME